MKQRKGVFYALLLSILCLIIGSICIGVGLAKGGSLAYLHIGKDNTSWWPFQGSFGIFLDDEDYGKQWVNRFGDISSFTLEIAMGDVEVRSGSENNIQFFNIYEEDVTIEQKDTQMRVCIKNQNVFTDTDAKVIITLKDKRYRQIDIVNDLGDIELLDIGAKYMTIEEKLGDIALKNISSDELNVEQSAGDIDISGRLMGNSVIQNSMGDIDVKVDGKQSDYRYKVKTSLGDTELPNKEIEGMCDIEEGNFSSQHYLQIHNRMGDVELAFTQ